MPEERNMNVNEDNKNARSLSDSIEEMRVGYCNTQELIRFMDAKMAIIWGICAAIIAHCKSDCIVMFGNVISAPCTIKNLLILIIIAAVVLSTAVAFWATMDGIWGRKEQGVTTPLPHILFPIGNRCDIHQFKRLIGNRSEFDAYEEMCDQLYSVGKILEIKIDRSRLASLSLIVQLTSSALLLATKSLCA